MRLEPLLIAPALVVVPVGCSENPVGADLPAILLEASAEDPVQGGSPARRAVRDSLRHVLEVDKKYAAEIERHFHRPELYSYLFLAESYVGGTFPGGTAVLLREVQQLEDEYLKELLGFPELLATNLAQTGVPAEQRSAVVDEMAGAFTAQRQPIVAVIEKHRTFVEAA